MTTKSKYKIENAQFALDNLHSVSYPIETPRHPETTKVAAKYIIKSIKEPGSIPARTIEVLSGVLDSFFAAREEKEQTIKKVNEMSCRLAK